MPPGGSLLAADVIRHILYCRLGKRAVQVRVSGVNENMLGRDVARLLGNQEQDHRGDLRGRGHAPAQRYLRHDFRELLLRIVKSCEPLLVERRLHFGGNHRVHANAVRQQLRGPFAGERQNRAFRSYVSRSSALAR